MSEFIFSYETSARGYLDTPLPKGQVQTHCRGQFAGEEKGS